MSRMHEVFSEGVVDELRLETGYNPRQRRATAYRLLLCCVEACLFGKTLGFAAIQAFFVKRLRNMSQRAICIQRRFTGPVGTSQPPTRWAGFAIAATRINLVLSLGGHRSICCPRPSFPRGILGAGRSCGLVAPGRVPEEEGAPGSHLARQGEHHAPGRQPVVLAYAYDPTASECFVRHRAIAPLGRRSSSSLSKAQTVRLSKAIERDA